MVAGHDYAGVPRYLAFEFKNHFGLSRLNGVHKFLSMRRPIFRSLCPSVCRSSVCCVVYCGQTVQDRPVMCIYSLNRTVVTTFRLVPFSTPLVHSNSPNGGGRIGGHNLTFELGAKRR